MSFGFGARLLPLAVDVVGASGITERRVVGTLPKRIGGWTITGGLAVEGRDGVDGAGITERRVAAAATRVSVGRTECRAVFAPPPKRIGGWTITGCLATVLGAAATEKEEGRRLLVFINGVAGGITERRELGIGITGITERRVGIGADGITERRVEGTVGSFFGGGA